MPCIPVYKHVNEFLHVVTYINTYIHTTNTKPLNCKMYNVS